jgi:hypothetical protein
LCDLDHPRTREMGFLVGDGVTSFGELHVLADAVGNPNAIVSDFLVQATRPPYPRHVYGGRNPTTSPAKARVSSAVSAGNQTSRSRMRALRACGRPATKVSVRRPVCAIALNET